MITIHHLSNSRSQRVLWLLEELELAYEVKRYERLASLAAPPELKQVHPLGKSPVLEDDGLTIAETGAIVSYLVETHGDGRLAPARGTPDWWRYQHFLHYAEGSLMPPLLMKLTFSLIPDRASRWLRPILKPALAKVTRVVVDPRIALHLGYCEGALAGTGWFVGRDLTAADVMMSFPLEAAGSRFSLDPYPNCRAFLDRIHARGPYAKALERGGPYAYAKPQRDGVSRIDTAKPENTEAKT